MLLPMVVIFPPCHSEDEPAALQSPAQPRYPPATCNEAYHRAQIANPRLRRNPRRARLSRRRAQFRALRFDPHHRPAGDRPHPRRPERQRRLRHPSLAQPFRPKVSHPLLAILRRVPRVDHGPTLHRQTDTVRIGIERPLRRMTKGACSLRLPRLIAQSRRKSGKG